MFLFFGLAKLYIYVRKNHCNQKDHKIWKKRQDGIAEAYCVTVEVVGAVVL